MQASQFVTPSLSHTKAFNTTLQSGAGSIFIKKLLMKSLDSTDPSTSIKAIHMWRVIQSLSCLCMQCHRTHFWCFEAAISYSCVPSQVWHDCPSLSSPSSHSCSYLHDTDEISDMSPPDNIGKMLYQNEVNIEANGRLASKLPQRAEKEQANVGKDEMARNMWDQYQNELQSRGQSHRYCSVQQLNLFELHTLTTWIKLCAIWSCTTSPTASSARVPPTTQTCIN